MTTFWGIHNDTLADELLDGGFVALRISGGDGPVEASSDEQHS